MNFVRRLVLVPVLLVLAAPPAAAETDPVGVWPLRPEPAVVHGFDPPATPFGPGHRGVDLLGGPGQAVHAALAGTVTYAGMLAGRGVVVVAHGATRTTYEPVTASVAVGQPVASGRPARQLSGWAARTASRAPACTGAGSPVTPTSTRSGWSVPGRSGCSRSGVTSLLVTPVLRLGDALGGTPLAAGPW